MKNRSLDRLFKMLDERTREVVTLRKLLDQAEDILFHYEMGDRSRATMEKQTRTLERQIAKYHNGIKKRLEKSHPILRGRL